MAGRAISTNLAQNAENKVFGGHTFRQLAFDLNKHCLRLTLRETLRRQHVLDLRRTNAKSQRAECAVGAGMAVAAHNRHPRLRVTQLRTDHVHDALVG